MDAVKEFLSKCINYLKANPTLAYILIGAAALVFILLIVIIARAAKRSKAKKRIVKEELAKKQALEKAEQEKAAAEKAKADKAAAEKLAKEKAEADRKAVFAKLEAQARAAEKAKAEEQAAQKAEEDKLAAEKVAKENAKAEKIAAEKAATEKIVAEKVVEEKKAKAKKEKAPAKAVQEKKEEIKEETKAEAPALYDEMANAKEEDDVWYEENETEKAARYKGKWTICRVLTDEDAENEMYFFELHASNGEKLLSSEEYTSYSGALRGIETHKANILRDNFKITLSKKGDYIFKLLSGKNMLLCMGENYPTRARCESAIESTKRFAQTAVVDENIHDHLVKVPVEDESEVLPLPDGYNGKWIIQSQADADGENVFYFELFANNGEKLLSSEEYTTYIGAVNGIQTHKNNIAKGNFRVSLTKRGDYIYKLLNGNGQLLCLGEHYKTKRRCLNAVESVKRFAANSPVLTDAAHTK